MARILAFTNNKGGTGKSTLCTNLAHATAQTGANVLVVDLTSQTSTSTLLLGLSEPLAPEDTILAIFTDPPLKHLEDLIFESEKGLDVVASHIQMVDAVRHLSALSTGRDEVLKHELARVDARYDYIFIDSPGDLNELTANALVPAQRVLIPTRLNRTDFQCTEATLRFIDEAADYIGNRRVRVVLNMLDDRYLGTWANSHTGKLYQQACQTFADVLSPVTIPDSSDLRTAFDYDQTILETKPESVIAQRIRTLVEREVIDD